MKKLLCLLGGAMLLMNIQAQNNLAISVGETVPDIVLKDILNYKSNTAKLSDFKQPIIIDFFATWCAPCIEALPHLDSLQRRFGDSIQIFVVSYEPKATIQSFLANNHVGKTLQMAFISGDTTLKKYFPYVLIPHEVVISDGKVCAITSPEYINGPVIRNLCRTGQIDVPLKRDIMNFDRHKPLFKNEIGKPLDLAICQFLFTKHINGLGALAGKTYNLDSSSKRIIYTNRCLLAYFLQAVGFDHAFNRVVLEVSNPSRYIGPYENWGLENFYSLEMIVPAAWTNNKINSWMLKEFNLCLNMNISVQDRVTPCWVLKKIETSHEFNNADKLLSSKRFKNVSDSKNWNNYNDSKTLKNSVKEYKFTTINGLIDALNMQKVGRPLVPIVLDETGDNEVNISLRLKNLQNLPATALALRKYGLTLIPAVRKIKMLVVHEADGTALIK